MRLLPARQRTELPGVSGPARIDRRTRRLALRLRPGDVAVIDHLDLDGATARALIGARVAAVVNVAASTSGRYPNLGPQLLVDAGVPLLDAVGSAVLTEISEGERLRVCGDELYAGERLAATGQLQTVETVAAAMDAASDGLGAQLEAFVGSAAELLRRERGLLLDRLGVPELRNRFERRDVLVVVPGPRCEQDLRALRPYLREHRPVLVAVDAGADALLEAGLRPDLIVGDVDGISDAALTSGADLVVREYPDGGVPGLQRLQAMGLDALRYSSSVTNQDFALLLAEDNGATVIVAAGTPGTIVELLDSGRAGMASSVLTRLRLGGRLVDAQAASRLCRSPISSLQLVLLVLAALLALAVALSVTDVGHGWLVGLEHEWGNVLGSLQRVVSK